MNYIEKLFKQYPFLYCINNQYYIFGTGICKKVEDKDYFDSKKIYEYFKENLNEDLDQREAFLIFRKVVYFAEKRRLEDDYKGLDIKFEKLNFNDEEIKVLENQCKQYVDFFRKYNLNDYDYWFKVKWQHIA